MMLFVYLLALAEYNRKSVMQKEFVFIQYMGGCSWRCEFYSHNELLLSTAACRVFISATTRCECMCAFVRSLTFHCCLNDLTDCAYANINANAKRVEFGAKVFGETVTENTDNINKAPTTTKNSLCGILFMWISEWSVGNRIWTMESCIAFVCSIAKRNPMNAIPLSFCLSKINIFFVGIFATLINDL